MATDDDLLTGDEVAETLDDIEAAATMPAAVETVLAGLEDDYAVKLRALLEKIPSPYREHALGMAIEFGPKLFDMAITEITGYLTRMNALDVQALLDLQASLSDAQWLVQMRANVARWEAVAKYNKYVADARRDIAMRLLPVAAAILFALVGL